MYRFILPPRPYLIGGVFLGSAEMGRESQGDKAIHTFYVNFGKTGDQ